MKIFVLGCGAYASALSIRLNKKNNLTMWCSFEEEMKKILETRESPSFKGVYIPKDIKITTSFDDISNSDLIILAIPAIFVSNVLEKASNYIKDMPIVIASKGITSDGFISDIVKTYTNKIAVISGPSFAIDTVKEIPIGITIASNNITDLIVKAFECFSIDTNTDIIGTEICGSIKNVFAIGAGILNDMSESTKCTYITKCLLETSNLIKKFNGNENTVLSYAGIGDLILTANSNKSRNYSLGCLISKGNREEIKNYINNNTVEGLNTLHTINKLFSNINMPIITILYDIIYNNKSFKTLIDYLKS